VLWTWLYDSISYALSNLIEKFEVNQKNTFAGDLIGARVLLVNPLSLKDNVVLSHTFRNKTIYDGQ